jgi:pyrrolidone-carboxylate peptidase
MLPGYFIYPAEQVLGTYWVQVRVGYGTGTYWVRHVMYRIILISLTGRVRSRYGWVRVGYGQDMSWVQSNIFGHLAFVCSERDTTAT